MTKKHQKPFYLLLICLITVCISPDSLFANSSSKKRVSDVKALPKPSKPCDKICQEWVARKLLKSALDFYKLGEIGIAERYLNELKKSYPNTKAALYSRTFKPLDHSGRVEFIVFSTAFAIYNGITLPLMFKSNNTTVMGVSILGFTGLGLVSSLLGTRELSINTSHTRLVETSTLWGIWNFAAIGLMLELNFEDTLKLIAVGGALGFGAGFVAGRYLPLKEGKVTFASSTGIWAAAYTGLVLGILEDNGVSLSTTGVLLPLLLASDLGLVLGAIIHPKFRFSRSRTLLVNLSGVVGGLVGLGVLLIAGLDNIKMTPVLATIGGTSLAGLGLGIFLTRHMKKSSKAPIVASNGSLLQYHKGNWYVGMPVPRLLPSTNGTQPLQLQVTLPLASGNW